MASDKSLYQVLWSRYQKSIFARTTRLFGEYSCVTGRDAFGGSQPLSDSLAKSLKSRWVASYGPAPTGQTESKQSTWDKPGILAEYTAVEETRTSLF